jgi:hypothetical protein
MKINYHKLLELNRESLTLNGSQLICFHLIQGAVENYLSGNLNEQQKQFLIDIEVLIESEEESQRRNIVGPFNFSTNGSPNS